MRHNNFYSNFQLFASLIRTIYANFFKSRSLNDICCMYWLDCMYFMIKKTCYLCICVLLGLTKELKDRLQISQNKLIRVALGLGPRDHVGKQQFQQLGWLPLEARAIQLQLRMVHNIYNNRAPEGLIDHLRKRADSHAHHTRASTADLCLPRFKTNMGKCSFKFCRAEKWNKLPLHIKSLNNHVSFKKVVKTWLLDNLRD